MASPADARQARSQGARRTLRSFGYAFEGVVSLFRTQANAWVHLGAAIVALGLCAALHVTPPEAAAVLLAIGLVFAAECANTAIEALSDLTSPTYHPLVKRAKDTAAAGVLLSAMTAIGVAAVVFLPRLAW